MSRFKNISWRLIGGLVLAAAGCFVMGFGHIYQPDTYCFAPKNGGVCVGMFIWFGLGALLVMLTMAKLFDDAMRFFDD